MVLSLVRLEEDLGKCVSGSIVETVWRECGFMNVNSFFERI